MIRRLGGFGNRLTPLAAAALLSVAPVGPATAAAPASTSALVTTVAPAPSVDELIGRYLDARGGLKKIRSIQTLKQTGRIMAGPNRTARAIRMLKRPGRIRFEFTVQGVTGVFVSDGQQGWRVSPFEGDMGPAPLDEEVVKEAAEQADIEGPLVDWKAKGQLVELVGREMVGSRESYKLKVTLKSGMVRYEYLDAKSFYLLRSEFTRQIRGRPVQIETTYGDHKKTGGVLFPRLIEVAAAERPQRLKVVVDKLEINVPLSDALFEMPAEAKP